MHNRLQSPQPGAADQNNVRHRRRCGSAGHHVSRIRTALPFLVSGQANIVLQAKPGMHSPYEGD